MWLLLPPPARDPSVRGGQQARNQEGTGMGRQPSLTSGPHSSAASARGESCIQPRVRPSRAGGLMSNTAVCHTNAPIHFTPRDQSWIASSCLAPPDLTYCVFPLSHPFFFFLEFRWADPDGGRLERSDVPRDRVAGWCPLGDVLLHLLHRPDVVW